MTVTLNQGQQACADGFFAFLLGTDPAMIISGAGGVGKTFVMGYLIDTIMPRYLEMCELMGVKPEYDQVVMTATTNQAASVLAQATKRPTSTIHSFLGLKVQNDYDTGRTKLIRTGKWTVHSRKVIFIDECSTVDPPLLRFIEDGTINCKVVYVGDHCQLGPVGYTTSPLYKLGLPFYELTEPMRNANQPALVSTCLQLRTAVETGTFLGIKMVPGVIDHVDDSTLELLIQQHFTTQNRENRILAYTNNRVIQYNDHIRTMRGLPDTYGSGEILVNNSATKLNGKFGLSVEEEVEIIGQASYTENLQVDENNGKPVNVKIRRSSLRSNIGMLYYDVSLPVDRNHVTSLIKYYAKIKDWERMYFLKEFFPDLRPRDACTIHKAQGSSYDTVFIDVGNLSECHQPNIVSRLLYVAFSRARKRVVLYGDLAQKYGGLIQ